MKMIKIREACINDYDDIAKLVREVHYLHVMGRPDDYKDCENPLNKDTYLELLSGESHMIYVAENELLQITGYTILKKLHRKNHEIMQDKAILYIEDLCVGSSFRRRGIGKALFNQAKECFKDLGFDSIELMVWTFNEGAIEFYESIGMKPKFIRYEL
jgi:ribosomal protein S18 acetylase RimI-like enzyme